MYIYRDSEGLLFSWAMLPLRNAVDIEREGRPKGIGIFLLYATTYRNGVVYGSYREIKNIINLSMQTFVCKTFQVSNMGVFICGA